MEEEKKLYPLKFTPIVEEKPWGTETYLVADLGFADSSVAGGYLSGNSLGELMETYLERMVGDKVYYYYGRQFPLGVKLLSTRARTPLTVCPDDDTAAPRFDALGKKKVWHIISAGPGAEIRVGLSRDLSAAELYESCADGSIKDLLRSVPVRAGQSYVIEPGIVHCASSGLLIAEISEASALDFTLCDWGRPCDDQGLGLVEALDFVSLSAGGPSLSAGDKVLESREMNLTRMALEAPLKVMTGSTDSFVLYTCVAGSASVQSDDAGTRAILKKGESVLIPAEMPVYFLVPESPSTVLLEALMDPGELPESYINQIV